MLKSNTLSKLGCNTALTAAAGAGGGSCRTESALGHREGECGMSEKERNTERVERGVSSVLVLAQHLCMLCGPTRGDDKQQPPPSLAFHEALHSALSSVRQYIDSHGCSVVVVNNIVLKAFC